VHDELVQTIKWKLARGKFRPNLVNLVQMNTPRVVMQETKKAFRKLQKTNDLQSAIQALCNVKGVGPAMASAVMAAGAPHAAPFMADECLLAMPEISLDYTMKEYMRYVDYVKVCVDRLNTLGETAWTPHKVELAVWTHYILRDLKPEVLIDMPAAEAPKPKPIIKPAEEPSGAEEPSKEVTQPTAAAVVEPVSDFVANGDEDTKSSMDSEAADQPPVTEQQELTEAKNHTQEVSLPPEAPKPSAAVVAAVIEEEVTQTPAPVAVAEVTQPPPPSAPVVVAEVTEPPPSAPVVAAEVTQPPAASAAPVVVAEVTEPPPPSAPVAVAEAKANGSEEAEVISTTQETPKTNGNNSHSSNGSSEKNGDDHPQQQAEAKKK